MKEKIKKFFRLGTGAYISLLGAIVGLVAMVFAILSSNCNGYAINEIGMIIAFSIIAILLVFVSIFFSKKHGNSFWLVYLPLLISAILFGICFIVVLNARSYLIGTLWATQLDAGNPDAVAAMNTGAPSFIMFVISMLITTVGSFFSFVSKKNIKVEKTTVESID